MLFRSRIFPGKGKVTYGSSVSQQGIVEEYEGDWFDGTNEMYHAEIVPGNIEGFGRYTYSDGAVYEGRWRDGKVRIGFLFAHFLRCMETAHSILQMETATRVILQKT
jgi:hypothetical protein